MDPDRRSKIFQDLLNWSFLNICDLIYSYDLSIFGCRRDYSEERIIRDGEMLIFRIYILNFAGPSQIGRVSGIQMLLLAILLLGQLRDYQDLPLYLAILDLRWAFDVARLDNMRLTYFEAGVRD